VGCEIVLLIVYRSNLPPPLARQMASPSHTTRAGATVRFSAVFKLAVSGFMNPDEI
jgi:hypothetical protein